MVASGCATHGPRAGRSRRYRVRWGRLLTAVAVLYLLCTWGAQGWRLVRLNREFAALEDAIRTEQERAGLLELEIQYRQTDEFIEHLARRELGLVKPGEVPVLTGIRP